MANCTDTAKIRVRKKVPHARIELIEGRLYAVVRGNSYSIGYGKTREAAWINAAKVLKV